ncbi:uncharacterized protein METZ01_LOCUS333082, partial [marine metagenome]
ALKRAHKNNLDYTAGMEKLVRHVYKL